MHKGLRKPQAYPWICRGFSRILDARDIYQAVVGIDRTFFSNLYVNLQLFADLIENGQESLASKRKTHGITFEISDKFLDNDLMAGFRGMYFTIVEMKPEWRSATEAINASQL